MSLTEKLTEKEFENIAKELIAVLSSKGISIKDAEEILSIAHNRICDFKCEPMKNREAEPLSGILVRLT